MFRTKKVSLFHVQNTGSGARACFDIFPLFAIFRVLGFGYKFVTRGAQTPGARQYPAAPVVLLQLFFFSFRASEEVWLCAAVHSESCDARDGGHRRFTFPARFL